MALPVPSIPSDPGLPGARGLFGPGGVRTVAGFLADRGWTLSHARPVQAMYRPGRSLLVRYRVAAEGPVGPRSLTLCAEARARARGVRAVPEGFVERFDVADPVERRGDVLVWAFPYDPFLSGSADAAWGGAVRESLSHGGRRPAAVSVEPVRYRPRRRAVFRYRALHLGQGGRRWVTAFGKVLPRDKVRRIEDAASGLRRVGRRVPLALPSFRVGEDGFVIPAMAGRSLRDVLISGGSLPSPSRVASLPATLAAAVEDAGVTSLGTRPTASALAAPAAETVARLVPESGAAAHRIVEAAVEEESDEPPRSSVVHGDLYEAQVFVGAGFRLGLIDLDDLGQGDAALDAANFSAHLLALAMAVPAAADRLLAYRRLVRPAFASALRLAPGALAWREAVCMLLLATGPFRVLDPAWPFEVGRRVALAVRLLEEP
jgi:Phosphotransferase enzyme family